MKKILELSVLMLLISISIDAQQLYGVFSFEGKLILPFDYDRVEYNSNETYTVRKGEGKWSVIDLSGNTIIPEGYAKIEELGDFLMVSNSQWKKGLYDKKGNQIVPVLFSFFKFYDNNLIHVNGTIDGSPCEGLYDYNGKQIIEFNDKSGGVVIFKNGNILHFITTNETVNNKAVLYDKNMNVIKEFKGIVNGIGRVFNDTWNYCMIPFPNDYRILIDADGNEIVSGFTEWMIFDDGFAYVKNGESVFIDLDKNVVFKIPGVSINGRDRGLYSLETLKGEMYGYANLKGEIVVKPEYKYEERPKMVGDHYMVKKKKYYALYYKGKEVLQSTDEFQVFDNIIVAKNTGGKWDMLDKTNYQPVVKDLESIDTWKGEDYTVKYITTGSKVYDVNGKLLIDCPNTISGIFYDLIVVWDKKNTDFVYGLMNLKGEIILPLEYQKISDGSSGTLSVKKDGKYLSFSSKDLCFLDQNPYNKNYTMIEQNGKHGVIDNGNNEVIPIIYNRILPIKIGFIAIKDGQLPQPVYTQPVQTGPNKYYVAFVKEKYSQGLMSASTSYACVYVEVDGTIDAEVAISTAKQAGYDYDSNGYNVIKIVTGPNLDDLKKIVNAAYVLSDFIVQYTKVK